MDILDLQTSVIFKSNGIKLEETISKLKIINFNPFEDSLELSSEYNKLIINKLITEDNKKLYIETDYLKIKSITNLYNNSYKLVLESNEELKNIFNNLDKKCKLLLQDLLNSNDLEKINNINLNKSIDKIDYYSIINNDTNEFKIFINELSLKDINVNDSISVILEIDYISFIIENLQARTKLNTFYLNLSKLNNIEPVIEPVVEELVLVEEVAEEVIKPVVKPVVEVVEEVVKPVVEDVVEEVVEQVEVEKLKGKKKQPIKKTETLKNNKKNIKKETKLINKDINEIKEEGKEVKKIGRKPNKQIIIVDE